jgi:hypothetical protein
MEKEPSTIVDEGFDEAQFEKPAHRREIDAKRQEYLAKGGTIKRFIPPFMPSNFYHCDAFEPGVGAYQTPDGLAKGIKDTMERKPRPPKTFGKK